MCPTFKFIRYKCKINFKATATDTHNNICVLITFTQCLVSIGAFVIFSFHPETV